jgi:hypothetical protein
MSLKPQDILVALKIWKAKAASFTFADMGESLGLSVTETFNSFHRAEKAGLVFETENKEVIKANPRRLLDFIIHGVPVVFFAERGLVTRGTPTGVFAEPLAAKIQAKESDIALVWPDENGSARGEALRPLYPTVPAVAKRDSKLGDILILIDGLRTGKSNERKIATAMLEKIFSENA